MTRKSPVKKRLDKDLALADLESLVLKGCDQNHLRALLGNLPWGHQNKSWKSLAKMDDPRDLEALAARIARLAAKIMLLNETPMMTFFGRFMAGTASRNLPAMLIQYAAMLKALARVAGPRRHSLEEVTRCLLIAYVRVRTGGFCDAEVSGVISAVTDKPQYDAKAHQSWRRRHRPALEVALKTLKNSRNKHLRSTAPVH